MAVHKGRALTSSRCPSSVRAYPWRRTDFKMRYSATLEIREMEALITGTNTRVMWERQSRTREVQAGRGVKMETAVEEDGRCTGCCCAHCAALLRIQLPPALLSRRALDLLSVLVVSFHLLFASRSTLGVFVGLFLGFHKYLKITLSAYFETVLHCFAIVFHVSFRKLLTSSHILALPLIRYGVECLL